MKKTRSRLHFVGIGGIGMAALAELVHARGTRVTGSDLVAGPTVERLRSLGVRVDVGHAAAGIGDAEAVVRSSAIPDSNPELVAARAAGLPVLERGALLAELMGTRGGIAIAGSHGKTTTSAMASHALEAAGLDPTALIGGRVPRAGGFASPTRLGREDLMVAEVDESDGSFLLTRPECVVITNADPEHLDHYGSRADLLDAFVEFANRVPESGCAILGIDHSGIAEIAPRIKTRQLRFGFSDSADVRIEAIEAIDRAQRSRLRIPGGERVEFDLPMPGRHNVLNAAAALAVGLEQGVAPGLLCEALSTFPGVARRFERKGAAGGVEIVDDYAHHPAELSATLAGARSIHVGPLTAIFQPHRFTRTRDCWQDFQRAFDDADRVVISEIYAASETPIDGIDGARLAAAIATAGHPDASFGGSLDEIVRDWPERFDPGELVLTLGAGDVVSLGPRLLAAIGTRTEGLA